MKQFRFWPWCAVLLCAVFTPAGAKQDPAVCGTHGSKREEELARHRQNPLSPYGRLSAIRAERLRSGAPLNPEAPFRRRLDPATPIPPGIARDLPGGLNDSIATAAPAPLPDRGDVAILSTAAGVVNRPNPFNLGGFTLRYVPVQGGYRVEKREGGYDLAAAGEGFPVEDIGDDDFRPFRLTFAFPFYGTQWRQAFLNSDGNLTFGQGEASTAARSLGRMHGGPPRIAALFRDLDPTAPGGAIRVLADLQRVVITWASVREFASFGNGVPQTFQIRLYPDGLIEVSYPEVRTDEAVVGITPGRGRGEPAYIDFLELPDDRLFPSTVAERFTNSSEVDVFTAAQRFYENHEDSYDYLVFFNSSGVQASSGALAFQLTVRNKYIEGIGDRPVDLGPETGSPKRLKAILNMGTLSNYPANPNAIVPIRAISGDTPLTVLAHEAGHLYLALASVRDDEGSNPFPMLGRSLAHWSFAFNSDASVMEGNRIEDLGPGNNPRFRTVAAVEKFSDLDLYLMGMLSSGDVGPMFYVQNASVSPSRAPQVGVGFSGNRIDFTIRDLIAAEGLRVPGPVVAQRKYRFAFVLIHPEGEPVPQEFVDKVDRFRSEFERFFRDATRSQSEPETTIRKELRLSLSPNAGLIRTRTIRASIQINEPTLFPLYLRVRTNSSLPQVLNVPSILVIPPGSNRVEFDVSAGPASGFYELRVEALSPFYEEAVARIAISPGVETVQLKVESDPSSPNLSRVRVTDHNLIPYPGVPVQAFFANGNSLQLTTDDEGIAEFRWGFGVEPPVRYGIPGVPPNSPQ
jgi:hypothetical protein